MMPEISVQELQALRAANADFMILDVRDPWEYQERNLGGHLIPLKELPDRLNELDKNQQIIVHCQMGGRSSRATAFLLEQGFKKVFNLRGGIQAWAMEIDPSMPR
ncbi:MAG: rhodanese-like domain-containing protein [Pseudomonadota bacterium]